jgi:16S rRNA (guanine1516-N2)-methyltransferase
MIPLICPSANLQGLAEELASNLRINVIIGNQPTDQPYLLFFRSWIIIFSIQKARSKNKFQIDFNSGSTGWRVKRANHEKLIKKALGKSDQPLNILDCTAGMLQDTLLFLSLGHKVTALEQSKILFYLLQDALRRCDDQSIFEKLDLIHTNACSYAAQAKNFDVVYFDPMYPSTKKNALTSGKLDYIAKILEIESLNNDSLEDFELLQLIPAKKNGC